MPRRQRLSELISAMSVAATATMLHKHRLMLTVARADLLETVIDSHKQRWIVLEK